MPDSNHYSALPVPTYSETPDAPAAFSSFRESIGSRIVLDATNESDRNNKYGSTPYGTIVSSTTEYTIWKKVGPADADWIEIFKDTGWVSLKSAAWNSNFSDIESQYRYINGVVNIKLNCAYSGPDVTVTPGDNPGDLGILTLPSAARPANTVWGLGETSAGPKLIIRGFSTGGVYLDAWLAGNSNFTNGQSLIAAYAYMSN